MIINEKRLAQALKSAGAVGFRLRVAGPKLELIGADWAAQICLDIMDEPPKLVLAALVEALGYLPGAGDRLSVCKGKSGWAAQYIQDAVFSEEFNGYISEHYAVQPCAVLPLRLGTRQLVQTLDRRVYGLGPGWSLRGCNDAEYLGTGCAIVRDRESVLAVRLNRADEPGAVWSWIESRDWIEDGGGNRDAEI